MYWCMLESRSDDDYGQPDNDEAASSWDWSDIYLFPVVLFLMFAVLPLTPFVALLCYMFSQLSSHIRNAAKNGKLPGLLVIFVAVLLFGCLALASCRPGGSVSTATPEPLPTRGTETPHPSPRPTSPAGSVRILVDDFRPQPYQDTPVYFYNRLGGDRGAINESVLNWGEGQVTTTISPGNTWGGVWMSLNHPIREGLPIDFSALLPSQILPAYQSQVTGIEVRVEQGTPGRTFKLELKDGGELRWKKESTLQGGQQVIASDLPALGEVNHLVWVLDHAAAGDSVIVDSVSFTATTQITDTAVAAFVWSYGMLLNNWNPETGLVRDKARDASGEFDAIQATGSLAAATAMAEQLGIIEHPDAIRIVDTISDTLLFDLPRFHGLWPHWVKVSPAGEIMIVEDTEWSSVDTAIAALGLLGAQSGLGLDTSGTEQMLREIDWQDLVAPGGISHGYTYAGDLIPYAWDVFGGESWLIELAYAGVSGEVAAMAYPSPPTANGSGFIDELAWLFVPPPSGQDYWGTDWTAYREAVAEDQILHYPTHNPRSCFAQLGLFGLSAAEVPDPSVVPLESIYQAFGLGGRFADTNDGSAMLGAPVISPHYAAMIASIRPEEALGMWAWLIEHGFFSPLGNAESLMFPEGVDCEPSALVWNHLKGSWNLALQTLGWGRYLAERDGLVPILWQAAEETSMVQEAYGLLTPEDLPPIPVGRQPYPGPEPHAIPGKVEAEDYNVGGEGAAYHDITQGNEGGEYRSDGVDIETATDLDGGYNVGWLEEGEWLAYTVDVASGGQYDIQVRVASALDRTVSETLSTGDTASWTVPLTPVLHVEFDGVDVSGPMAFVATGGWQNWTSVFARRIPLEEGEHVMRLAMDSGGANVNWVSFSESLPASWSTEQIVDWIIAQMTTAEKIEQLHGSDWMDTADNVRLGIPGFRTADGGHGLRGAPSTSFPVGIALAATWDLELLDRVGIALGEEFLGRGRNQVLGPCLDITRDPRNGRSPESGGEEPYLVARIGAAFIRGIQATQAIATPKHFAATNHQRDRRNADHRIDARTWREFYGLPFRMAVQQGGAWSIMNAYNWINGRPSSASPALLDTILRDEWGYEYYVVSDWGSIYTPAADAINAGCDLEMPHFSETYFRELPDAIEDGTVAADTLDEAVRRVLRAKLAAGLLGDYPLGSPDDVCSQAHRDLALEAAQKSIVLLKNEGQLLPLKMDELDSIALIGPSADVAQLDGTGSSVVEPCYAITPKQGIENRAPGIRITYAKGCDINSDDTSGFQAAIDAAMDADVVVFVGGLDATQEGEELDRASGSVQLPGRQQALINELAIANPNLVVVLESGGIVALEQCIQNIRGLIYAFYPGQEGGNALADVLFGNVNPGGKLPVTMPKNDTQLPAWDDLDFTNDMVDGFGYRRFDSLKLDPQYAFGYGLSYTTFAYENLTVMPTLDSNELTFLVQADVKNSGEIAGDEVVQLYLGADFTDPIARDAVSMPVKQLRGFDRVTLAPGQTQSVTFALGPDELSFWSVADDSFRIEAGTYTIQVGGSSDHLPLSEEFTIASPLLYNSASGRLSPAPPLLANLASNRTVTCSSIENPDYSCSNAVDGDIETRWSSQFSDPQWISVDLGARKHVKRVILHWEAAHGEAYSIQLSDDAVHWTDLYNTSTSDGDVDNVTVSGTGRYVRVHATMRAAEWGYSLWELEVYGGEPGIAEAGPYAPVASDHPSVLY